MTKTLNDGEIFVHDEMKNYKFEHLRSRIKTCCFFFKKEGNYKEI